MKKIHEINSTKYASVLLSIICAAGLLWFSGCSDDVPGEGLSAPTIDKVRVIDPAATQVTGTFAGSWLALEGNNFLGAKELYINDYPVYFNNTLVTNTHIIFQIPYDVTTAVTDPNVSNMLRLVTNHGEASISFNVLQSPPAITGISNYNATSGSVITVVGANLFALNQVLFPGGKSGVFTANEDGYYFTVTVPDSAGTQFKQAGYLTVTGVYGTGFSPLPVNNISTADVLYNFDDKNNWQWWPSSLESSSADFPNNTGSYIRMTFNELDAGDVGWWNSGRGVQTNKVTWNIDPSENVSFYSVQFEMAFNKAWKSGPMYLGVNDDFTYLARVDSPDTTNGFKPTGWVTFTVPLTSFKKNNSLGLRGKGDPISSFNNLVDANNQANLEVMFMNESGQKMPAFDAAIDNMRVVRIRQ